MPSNATESLDHLTLEQLLALNDEILALVRCGVPLDRGLLALSADMPERLGRLAAEMSERLSRGEPLSQALAASSGGFSKLYAAMLTAGMRANRLPLVLESLASSGQQLLELRRATMAIMFYPFLVVVTGYLTLCMFLWVLVPPLALAFADLQPPGSPVLNGMAQASEQIGGWWLLPLAVALLLAGIWVAKVRRASLFSPQRGQRLLGWIPYLKRVLVKWELAAFVDLLAVLIEHETPLDEALELAAPAIGNAELQVSAASLAAGIRRGESPGYANLIEQRWPPLLAWLLITEQRSQLPQALRQAADNYRQQANSAANLLQTVLPILFTGVVGGGVVLFAMLVVYWPWVHYMFRITQVPGS